ncbi:MAG: hypothetical protein IT360_10300 [Gemmatimonadaceae bacterium]|nr:hypothetical protein [Gemmatimonadaceae bacterium]
MRLTLVFILCVGVGYAGAQVVSGRANARNVLSAVWRRASASSVTAAPAVTVVSAPASIASTAPSLGGPLDSSALLSASMQPVGVLPLDVPLVSAAAQGGTGDLINPDILPSNTPVRVEPPPAFVEETRRTNEPTALPVISAPKAAPRSVQSPPADEPSRDDASQAASRRELVQLEQQYTALSGRFSALREFYAKMERTVERNGGSLRIEILTALNTGSAADRNAADALADGDVARLRANLSTLDRTVRLLDDAKTK